MISQLAISRASGCASANMQVNKLTGNVAMCKRLAWLLW
jgi:hypothetical protein